MEIVSKAEFARLCNVTRGRMSQWLGAGQIGPEALVGIGRHARINVQIATAHLRERLDPAQRFGLNGLRTHLAAPSQGTAEGQSAGRGHKTRADRGVSSHVDEQIKREKLRQAELTTIRAEERDRLARGMYVLASAMREETGRLATKMFEAFDGALIDFASAFAARYQIPARDALHLLRKEMVKVRDRVSAGPDTERPTAWH